MKLLNEILVATDFGSSAENAVETAVYAAKQFDSRLHLLHVKPRSVEAGGAPRDIEQAILNRLNETAQKLEGEGVRRVEPVLESGLEFVQIDRYARRHDVNAIIIGAGEPGGAGQVYLGTTAARLRRKSSKPVWIVKPGIKPPISRILCPVDFSNASGRALKNAIHLARRFQAQLMVLTVVQTMPREYEWAAGTGAAGEEQPPFQVPEFDAFLALQDFHAVDHQKVIRQGRPREEIVKVAVETGAELIVMGSVGRTGISRMLVGGVARRVAQEMPCSIITVRSEEPIRLRIEEEISEVDVNFCASKKKGMRCDRLEQGQELLAEGFPEQAAEHFRDCIREYDLCPHAWQCLGQARARLGDAAGAEECEARAKELDQILYYKEIEADVRENDPLFRHIFGM